MIHTRFIVALLAVGLSASGASAAVATFDSLEEGTASDTFEDGGILFYSLDCRFPDEPPPNGYCIEQADGELAGQAGFSALNVLAFAGFSTGPGVAFGHFGEMRFKLASGEPADFAQLELFAIEGDGPSAVTLQAWRSGAMVDSSQVSITEPGIEHFTLAVSGAPFDELRLVSSGELADGVTYAVLDNVVITPEPATAGLLLAGAALLRRRSQR